MPTLVPPDALERLRNGGDLRVVLRANPQFNARPYIESYHLPLITIANDRIWGAMRSVHMPNAFEAVADTLGQSEVNLDTNLPTSYLYCSDACFVTTTSFGNRAIKFYARDAYEYIQFVVADRFEPVYDAKEPRDISTLRERVRGGKLLKAVLVDPNGVTKIIPIHTAEVTDDGQAAFTTEADTVPGIVENGNEFQHVDDMFRNAEGTGTGYNSTGLIRTYDFISTHFVVKSPDDAAHWNLAEATYIKQDLQEFRVFAEK